VPVTARDLPPFGLVALYSTRHHAEEALTILRDSAHPPASLEIRDAASLGLSASDVATEDEAMTRRLGRAVGVGALVGALAGVVLGAVVGLIVHAAMGSDSSVAGAEIVGVLVGLVVGAILGAFYGGAVRVSRARRSRPAALVVGAAHEADAARLAELLVPTAPERTVRIGPTGST
jgi:hypothetical protein